jgi:hypothetical protein
MFILRDLLSALQAPFPSINNKTGRRIFGCGFCHDHTAKLNQPLSLVANALVFSVTVGHATAMPDLPGWLK